jgi:hypothetical protein
MTIDELLRAAMKVEEDIEGSAAGGEALAEAVVRLDHLQAELGRIRGLDTPLIPDTARAPSDNEQSVASLDVTLRMLRRAALAKQSAP